MRPARAAAASGLAATLVLLSAAPVALGGDRLWSGWSQFHGSWTHDGVVAEAQLRTTNVDRLTLRWAVDVGEVVQGSPAIDGRSIFVAGWDGSLVALSQKDGHELWRQSVGEPMIVVSPALYRKTVIVSSGTWQSGHLWAFASRDGTLLWSTPVPGGIQLVPPTVYGDTVFLASSQGAVFAYSARTGALLWSRQLTTAADSGFNGPVAVSPDGTLVVAAGMDGQVYALRTDSGTIQWTAAAGRGVYRGGPAISGQTVYVPSGDAQAEGGGFHVAALRLSDGALLWTQAAGDDVHATPAVGSGTVFVGAIDGSLHAIDAATGDVRWVAQLEHEIWSSPAFANGVVYLTTESSFVALAADDGTVLFYRDMTTGYALMASPAVYHGTVYLGTEPGGVMALGLRH
jgi:outer membrane protein assembly factor BamB